MGCDAQIPVCQGVKQSEKSRFAESFRVKAAAEVSRMGMGEQIESRYPGKSKIIEQNWVCDGRMSPHTLKNKKILLKCE